MGVLRSGIGTGIACGVSVAGPGRSPRSPPDASLYWERTGSVEVRVLDTVHTRSILLSSTVIRPIFCAVDSPRRGRWSSFTTTNSALYFFDVLGFLSTRRHLPRGSISAPFHMINFEEVCCNFRGACPLGDGVHTGSRIDLEGHRGGAILASQHPVFQLPPIWWVDSMNPFSITVRVVLQVSFLYYMYGLCLLGALHSKMVLPVALGAGPAIGGAFRLHHFMHHPTEFALFHGQCHWVVSRSRSPARFSSWVLLLERVHFCILAETFHPVGCGFCCSADVYGHWQRQLLCWYQLHPSFHTLDSHHD